jgi:hypothetical protein
LINDIPANIIVKNVKVKLVKSGKGSCGNLNLGYDFETIIKSAKLLELQPICFIIRGIGVM